MTWYISDKDCAEDENRPPGDYYLDIFIKQEWADRIMDQFKAGASQDVLFHREVIL
jgi:hypothetical protein